MSGKPGGDKLGIGEIFWYRNDVASEDQAIEVLTDRGELFFYRLRRHYLYRAGTIPYDPSAICTKMGYKTVRPFNAAFDELVGAGLVSVENGMIRFPHADRIIADVQSNRDKKANDGRTGGEAKAANAKNIQETSAKLPPNFAEVSPKLATEIEQNQALSSSTITNNQLNKEEEAPLPPQAVPAKTMNGHANGSSSSSSSSSDEMHAHALAIVQAFDGLIVEFWGKQAARFAPADTDLFTAAKWLDRMEGDVSGVIQAIDGCMADEVDRGRLAPPRLSFYNGSITRFMAAASRPVTLTANSPPSAGKARQGGGEPLWMTMATKALLNWHDDISTELQRLGKEDPDLANAYAESVRELVSRPKERAAA
jgi:hypothetical protein